MSYDSSRHASCAASPRQSHWLRFGSLFHTGKALAFPCDARGEVDIGALSRPALNNYLYARAFVGREFLTPRIESCTEASYLS